MIRVLLVEDNAAHARLVHEMLKEKNTRQFEYRRVDTLGAALRLLYDQHFDVVLLDLALPDAFGPEAVVRIRKAAPSVPIVVLSGLREERLSLEAARLGAQEYLVKGEEDAEQLLRAIKDSIERGRLTLGPGARERPATLDPSKAPSHRPSAPGPGSLPTGPTQQRPLSDLLLIEDNSSDARLMTEVLRENGVRTVLNVARDGEEAMMFLRRQGRFANSPKPAMIVLDLNLPRKDGREVLAEIKQDPDLRRIPVVVLTTSGAEQDIAKSYDLHANCYIVKPIGLDAFAQVVRSIQDFWLTVTALPPVEVPAAEAPHRH
jgi:two-component system, chemotaxis family, response regulator Rcp1